MSVFRFITSKQGRTHVVTITLLIFLALIGCSKTSDPPSSIALRPEPSWQKSTRLETAAEERNVLFIRRFSEDWTFEKPYTTVKAGDFEYVAGGKINFRGMVIMTFRGENIEITRGVICDGLSHDKKKVRFGYLDLEEIRAFEAGMDRMASGNEKLLESNGEAFFTTKSGVTVNGDGKTFNFRLLGIKDTEEELNVAGLNKSDLAEIKMKLELARKWAENQGQ
ncbi:hypothetical protein ACFQAT_28280 [Undibacterium arcticum]|uniref:Lipoprotein n=1 Tax=Undibacterium arcticum TaxID=1762892 RepID=A0ABV7F751_9BURK